jgi:hypothetical protein
MRTGSGTDLATAGYVLLMFFQADKSVSNKGKERAELLRKSSLTFDKSSMIPASVIYIVKHINVLTFICLEIL